jgi:type IV secretory pathway ATPase VirB11/archaellum biosynthesis ATPase
LDYKTQVIEHVERWNKQFEEVVEEVIKLMSRRDKILIVGEIATGKTTFLQTIKSR